MRDLGGNQPTYQRVCLGEVDPRDGVREAQREDGPRRGNYPLRHR